MENPLLYVLPPFIEEVETHFTMETINYEYGASINEYGDREVVDVSREFEVCVTIPKISFLDWVETLCSLHKFAVETEHLYTKQIIPYTPHDSPVWGYFYEVRGNLLFYGQTYLDQDKVRIYMYFIEDFNYYVLLRLLSHHDKLMIRNKESVGT